MNIEQMHTDAKSQFLSKNSILMKSTPTFNLNFPAKNGIIENLIFLTKSWILPQCATVAPELSKEPVKKRTTATIFDKG